MKQKEKKKMQPGQSSHTLQSELTAWLNSRIFILCKHYDWDLFHPSSAHHNKGWLQEKPAEQNCYDVSSFKLL